MSHSPSSRVPVEEELSLPLFFATVAASLAVLYGLFWLSAPTAVWTREITAGAGCFIGAFLVVKMFNCFMEFFFHRYVLHKPVIPFLEHRDR